LTTQAERCDSESRYLKISFSDNLSIELTDAEES
jgi:hypothetical protein